VVVAGLKADVLGAATPMTAMRHATPASPRPSILALLMPNVAKRQGLRRAGWGTTEPWVQWLWDFATIGSCQTGSILSPWYRQIFRWWK